jgi:heat shock protein HslJ
MKKLTVILTVSLIILMSSVSLSGCLLLPIPQQEPTTAPATEPESEPMPTPALESETTPDESEETLLIENISWELEAYGDKESLKALIEETEITAEFKSTEECCRLGFPTLPNQVVGSGGCNSYFVDYEIDNNGLIVTPPISATRMECSLRIIDQEQEYFELLETTKTFRIHNDKLIISCSGNKELVFVKK